MRTNIIQLRKQNAKDHLRNALDSVVTGVPSGDHLFVLMDENARTGKRQSGCADSKVLGECGRDELNDNGETTLPRRRQQARSPQYVSRCAQSRSIVRVAINKIWKGAVSARLRTYGQSCAIFPIAFKVIANEKTRLFCDTTIFVTAKTRGIDAERENEKCI